MASVFQINVNPLGGVPKNRVMDAMITRMGVVGDKQKHRRFHGGPSRAVCLYAHECISTLRAEGHSIHPGSTGENLTIIGLTWSSLSIGAELQIGNEVILEITSYAAPCKQIADSFADGNFARISQKAFPGWSRLYAKVLREGTIREGDGVALVSPGDMLRT